MVVDSALLKHPRLRYSQLTPPAENAPGGRGTNYRIQMLLKIAIAALVPTEFYITLDSDVVVRRPVTFKDLVIDGKAIYQAEVWAPGSGDWGPGYGRLSMLTPLSNTTRMSK